MSKRLPPELEHLAALVDQQPPQVREAFQFCLAVAMEERGKSKLLNTAHVDGRVYYSYQTIAGDVFSVPRPEIDAEMEKTLRHELLRIVEEEWIEEP